MASEKSEIADNGREEWLIALRRKFSPPGMVNPDGSIRQEFFKPKRVIIVHDSRKWGDQEREGLYLGLEKHGVGKWKEIAEEFLSGWDETQLKVKTARLLGTQSLASYQDWKGNKSAVDDERVKNRLAAAASNLVGQTAHQQKATKERGEPLLPVDSPALPH